MQSHWCINHALYESVQNTLPLIAKFNAGDGTTRLEETPIKKHLKKIHPEIYKVPLFRRHFCKLMMDEIKHMQKEFSFEINKDEDELRQIPEIVLSERCPELYRNMWFIVQTVLNPIFFSIWQRHCGSIASVQIANYNLKDKLIKRNLKN